MFKLTRTEASKSHRRLLALIPVAVLALIVVSVFVSLRATATPQSMLFAPATSVEAVAVAAAAPGNPAVETTPRELVAMEAAGLVTLTRPRLSTTPRELVAMEAAGLVTLARPMPDPQLRPAWQSGAGYPVWGDCTNPLARQAAPELCMY